MEQKMNDINKMKQQSDEMKKLGTEVIVLVQEELNTIINELSSGWKGSCAKQYLHKTVILQKEINTIGSDIQALAETITSRVRLI